jgi:hypothetical protein
MSVNSLYLDHNVKRAKARIARPQRKERRMSRKPRRKEALFFKLILRMKKTTDKATINQRHANKGLIGCISF